MALTRIRIPSQTAAGAIPVRLTHLWRAVGGVVIAISDANFNLSRLELNSLGARVWELMDGERNVREIADHIACDFPSIPRARIEADVAAFIERLRATWLVMTREELDTYE